MQTLDQALTAASPRRSPPPTPIISLVIHGSVLALWVLLFARAFFWDDIFAWSVGIVYVAYDTALLIFVFWKTVNLAKRPLAPPAGRTRPSLSVIIATYNEGRVLPVTLTALLAQSDPPDRILIVDDGSTDDTAAVLARHYGLALPLVGEISQASSAHPNLCWLRVPHGGKARALNAAILQLDTHTVLTVDADTLLDPDAIASMRQAFAADPALVATTGILTPICGPSLSGRFFQWFQTYEYIRNFLSRYAWMRMDSLLLISGAFAGFRRDALLTVGGFEADCLVEDYELIHRLSRYSVRHGLDWRTSVLGSARARTDAPSTMASFLRQRRRWFGGFLQTQYWYRDMVGDRRYGWLGTLMLPVKAIDTMQPIYGLTAFVLLLGYIVTGRLIVIGPVAGVIGAKIVIDLAFHVWSAHLYRRWVGDRTKAHFGYAILAALAEPFSFQILRHAGAAWGWFFFLTGRRHWGQQTRVGVTSSDRAPALPPLY